MRDVSLDSRDILARLGRLDFRPPAPSAPINRFRPARIVGDLCFVSSMTPLRADGTEIRGQIGGDAAIEDAEEAARWCVANSLAWLAAEVEASSRRVDDVVDMVVYCNAVPGFGDQSVVADAASKLLEDVLPASLGHARGAIGASSLVRNSLVVAKVTYLLVPAGVGRSAT